MYKQTKYLCDALPHFADLFKAADKIGSAQWQIVQWEAISPQEVRPREVHAISGLLPSRTKALIESGLMSQGATYPRSEKAHVGVWKWQQDGKTMYQSVMPVLRYGASPQNDSIAADVVRETTEAPTSTMVRISDKASAILRRIADADGKTLQAVLDEALQEYDKQRFFKEVNAGYQALREGPKAWAEELQERTQSEATLKDDIDCSEIWHDDGTVTLLERERHSA